MDNAAMSTEAARLATFSQPSKFHFAPKEFAKAGFYYQGPADQMATFCCGLSILRWGELDFPMMVHDKFSKACPFVRNGFGNTRDACNWRRDKEEQWSRNEDVKERFFNKVLNRDSHLGRPLNLAEYLNEEAVKVAVDIISCDLGRKSAEYLVELLVERRLSCGLGPFINWESIHEEVEEIMSSGQHAVVINNHRQQPRDAGDAMSVVPLVLMADQQ